MASIACVPWQRLHKRTTGFQLSRPYTASGPGTAPSVRQVTAQSTLLGNRYRLASIPDCLVGVHESALKEAATSRLQKVGREVVRQLSRPQIPATSPEVTERIGSQSKNIEGCRRPRANHADVEGRKPGAVPVDLLPKRRHLSPVRVPGNCGGPMEDGVARRE